MNENNGQQPTVAGLPAAGLSDADLFAHCITDDGLARLESLLDSGRYEVRAPEQAALLCVAWLRRAGAGRAAAELVEELRPFATEMRLAPYPAERPVPAADAVHRLTVGEAAGALARRGPRPAVEAQREALTVWQPGLSPATGPAVVEQARILTASPLATLVRDVGIVPRAGWDDLARGAFTAAVRRGATGRDVAIAWQRLVFHLSLCDAHGRARVLAWIDDRTARLPARAAGKVAGPLARLRLAVP